jgi:hypothetical protein
MTESGQRLSVARTIPVAASQIFEILSTPRRHMDLDGSDMLRGVVFDQPITSVGDTFTMKMHRLGRDYLMINYVVEFELDRRIGWEPAPGDIDTAGGDRARIGVPSGYRWSYQLEPASDQATIVTEIFDCGPPENQWIIESEGGSWINGSTTLRDSMTATLERLAGMCAN